MQMNYVQNWQNYTAFNHGNLTFRRYQTLSHNSVQDKHMHKHHKREHISELQQMLKMSSTSLHVLS